MRHLLLGAAVATLVITGCGGSDDDGDDATSTSQAGQTESDLPPQQLVDPCTVLSDADLVSLEQDPAKRRPVAELDLTGCGWSGRDFLINVTIDPDTIEVYQKRRNAQAFVEFRDIEVAGRPAVEFSVSLRGASKHCAVRVTVGSGSIGVAANDAGLSDVQRDLCAQARRTVELIVPKLPEGG